MGHTKIAIRLYGDLGGSKALCRRLLCQFASLAPSETKGAALATLPAHTLISAARATSGAGGEGWSDPARLRVASRLPAIPCAPPHMCLCGTPRVLDGPLSSVTHHCSSHLLCVCLDLQPMLRPRLPSSQGCIFRAARAATSVPPLRSPSGSHRPRVGQQHGGRLRPDRSGHVNRQGRCGGHCPQPMQQ